MVRQAGFEPTTLWFVARYSINWATGAQISQKENYTYSKVKKQELRENIP